jgi:hypothetical protein
MLQKVFMSTISFTHTSLRICYSRPSKSFLMLMKGDSRLHLRKISSVILLSIATFYVSNTAVLNFISSLKSILDF